MKKNSLLIAAITVLTILNTELMAQNWTNNDYKKVLWMTTRFYGAQRSGDNNWVLANHLPAGVDPSLTGKAFRADYNQTDNVDLSGGWHDCGDHVKFGQTQYYAAYLLLKGYAEFPTGYDDRYSFTYAGYKAANSWNFEGTAHDPNCIPDVLDEMKHETDYIIKCTPNSSTFWYQVGTGGSSADHCQWVTAVKMQTFATNCGGNNDNGTPGARRPSCKNPNDGMMASFAGATLALMARVYQPYDAAYAALCLTHAQYAYDYAKTRLNNTVGTCFTGFYNAPATGNCKSAFACCCAELYFTTLNNAYKTEAIGWEPSVNVNAGYTFDYENVGEIGLYCLAQLGDASATTKFNNRITGHFMAAGSRNGNGVYTAAGTWGRLRYNANAAFLISLYSKLNNNTTAPVITAIHNDIDYIMGKNASKRTYIVGFEPAAGGPFVRPLKPHHRNAYLRDDNPLNTDNTLTLPAKNEQLGAMVGGQRDATYNDNRDDYQNSEVCIDYNAGLVGALGFINSRLAPVTISCGGNACRQPNLGPNLSTCTTTLPTTLNANAGAPGGVISYRWYTWNGSTKTVISGQTGQTYSATALGAYIVERDSAYTGGPCTKRDTIYITNTFPTPVLTGPLNICNPATYDLTPTNLASFPGTTTWQWAVDYSGGTTYNNLTGETNSTLSNVRTAGRYRITATAGACTNNTNVVVTSNLPVPVDGCISAAGNVALSVANPGLNGTNYNWYTTASGSTLATTVPVNTATATTSITVNVASTTTYYVQDMSSVNATVGPYFPATPVSYGSGSHIGADAGIEMRFEAIGNYSITSLYIPYMLYNAGEAAKLATFEIVNDATGTVVTTTPQHTGVMASGSFGSQGVYVVRFNVSIPITGGTVGTPAVLRIRLKASSGSDGNPYLFNDNADPFDGSMPLGWNYVDNQGGNTMRLIGSRIYGTNTTTRYGFFVGFNISAGLSCARLPVIARVSASCTSAPVELVNFYAEKAEGRTILNWLTASETNNDYFHVERSLDGTTFEVIGTVNGMGTTNNATVYSYADENTPSGKVYYRLTQVDFDGQTSSSMIISVEKEILSLDVLVAPNPFTHSTEVFIRSGISEKARVTVTDLSGLIVYSGSHSTNENTSLGQNIAAGVYILQIALKDQIKTVRIVKQ